VSDPQALPAVRRAVRRGLTDLPAPARLVVACSGGADSLALLAAAVAEAGAGRHVAGVTVDHGLQPGSAQVADEVVATMAALGADETVAVRVQVSPGGRGPEAAAREARYAVLEEVADRLGADAVLLGHTRDDQAETVLLGLARGSGGRSLAGMRRSFDRFRRPLLDLARAETERACRELGLDPWQDPHNRDPAYARARVRHRVLPVLEAELGPGVVEALARTADLLRPDMELLDDLASAAAERAALPDGGLDVAVLAGLHPSLRRRVLHRAATAAGVPASDLTHGHVLATEELVTRWHGQRWVDLPGPRRAVRRGGVLRLVAPPFPHPD
jgi:tRNA(Ile)-lysidine synthase